jgi:gas vesicle protein
MVAFVIGAMAGAAVALLFAPATGEETRDYLGQKAREGKARLKEQRDTVLRPASCFSASWPSP